MHFVEGEIQQYLFYNEESSYSVIKIDIHDTDEPTIARYEPTLIICGFFPRLELKQNYRFFGQVTDHPKYGIQFTANRFEQVVERSDRGVIEYLSSDLFKGIGPKTAQAIVTHLGVDALDKIMDNPDVLDGIALINPGKKDIIARTLKENRQMETTLVWLYGFMISPRMAMKIYQRFGFASVDVIKQNPYVLMNEIEQIGFKRADEIALKIGFSRDHPLRIQAVLLYLLSEYMNKFGDTYVDKEPLIDYAAQYLNQSGSIDLDLSVIGEQVDALVMDGQVVDIERRLSLASIYFPEKALATSLIHRIQGPGETADTSMIEKYLDAFELGQTIQYTDKQRQAIITALTNDLTIITGGPGTGKTTIIDAIAHIFSMIHHNLSADDIKLAAPTGKAAKRLSEATSREATTIHRLLGYDYEGRFTYDKHHPLRAELVIIDEVSMMDTLLGYHFFQALSSKTKLVLVGDHNQLPSVGPGQVLSDLIDSSLIDVVYLDRIHRQAQDSAIVSLAYDVLHQHLSEEVFNRHPDREFILCREHMVPDYILKSIHSARQSGYTLLDDIQVLIPMYKGANGIDRINQLIQERFNAHNKAYQIVSGDRRFRLNDKVMLLVNQPEDGVMNGDIGIITDMIEDKEMIVDFSGIHVKYNVNDLDNITLAYAISIHKAQGSEFRVVILPLVRSYRIMLKRKLLYTAITRAKEHLIMIGDKEALHYGVYDHEPPRKTWLREMLKLPEETKQKPTIADFM